MLKWPGIGLSVKTHRWCRGDRAAWPCDPGESEAKRSRRPGAPSSGPSCRQGAGSARGEGCRHQVGSCSHCRGDDAEPWCWWGWAAVATCPCMGVAGRWPGEWAAGYRGARPTRVGLYRGEGRGVGRLPMDSYITKKIITRNQMIKNIINNKVQQSQYEEYI